MGYGGFDVAGTKSNYPNHIFPNDQVELILPIKFP